MNSDVGKLPKSKPKFFDAEDKEAISWFWNRYLKSKFVWLLLILAMVVVQGLVYQQFLRLTESGLRIVFDKGELKDLVKICAMVFGVFAVRGVVSYLTPRLSTWVASDAVQNMRNDMIAHYLMLDLAFFDRNNTGDIMLRLVQQAEALSAFVGQVTVKSLRDAATIIVLSAYLIYKQPYLFAATIAILPIIIFSIQKISIRIKGIQASAQAVLANYINGIEEMSNSMRTIRIAGQEEMEQARLASVTQSIKDITIQLQATQALVLPWMDLAAAVAFSMVIGGGGYMVLSPDFSTDGAEIIAFLIGLVLIFDPFRRLSSFFVLLQASLIILRSIRGLFFEKPTIFDAPDVSENFDATGDIIFNDVTFGYEGTPLLFENLNMTIKGQKTTAIVGPTGSGKTTILSLLGRLYECNSGSITFGGKSILDIKIKNLRGSFSVVAQDIVIFNKSIFENIKYVRPEATDKEIFLAAEGAEIKSLMLERGKTPVGPKGAQLSGGQKQRIAIARAFLRDEPIVLLDEATSALDQQTEDRVKAALNRLTDQKTCIVVAHRLSSVVDANMIYVLDEGRIVEAGSHADLMAKGELYASMFKAQKKGFFEYEDS